MYPIWSLHGLVCIFVAALLIVGDGSSASAQSTIDLAALNRQISTLRHAGKFGEAVPLAEMALRLTRDQKGEEHPDTAVRVAWLALLYRATGRNAEAEPLYRRSLAMFEKALGPEHPHVATALGNLAGLYRDQGRYAEAEPLYRRSLALDEKALGPEHPHVGASLGNLAELYRAQGRLTEAEPLYLRNLALYEKALGPEHPLVGTALNNLALLYLDQGRYAQAEPLVRRNLALTEKALGRGHPHVSTSLNNLAVLYRDQGRHREAEPLFRRSLAIVEKSLGPEHPDVGTALNNLAALYRDQGRHREAEPLFHRSLAIVEKSLGPEHPDVGTALGNLAWLALSKNDVVGAAGHWRRATALLQRRAERGLGGGSEGSSKGEAQRSSWYFEGLVKTTYHLATEDSGTAKARAADMFETAQWGVGSEAGASLAQMAARSAGGSPGLAALVRERQDLVGEWRSKDRLLIAARSEPPAKRNAAGEKTLSDSIAAIDARLAAIDVRLARDFPDYAALARPKPIAVADVQSSLRDDEALLLFLDTDARFKPLPEETFVWVVTNKDVRWLRSELGTKDLTREVAALRCGLDSTAWHGEGENRCASLLKLPLDGAPKEGQPLPFDVTRAHALYKGLLGKAEDVIRGKHLLIVPSGALTTLPFQVLVTKAPTSADLASASWLVRDHVITILPSAASLAALRRTGKPSTAPNPIIGFGNPLLDGDQAHPQHGLYFKQQAATARAQKGCATSSQMRTTTLRAARRSVVSVPQTSRLADLKHLRSQTPLPETADELCDVVRRVGGNIDDIRIGARATETEIKRLSASGELAKYRMLHFATHATLAGQLSGTSEPGLILTPPSVATAEDDGYLSGSEIAALKLDADWVILSACNTAGGAGDGEAAEALSGLARMFFYAGARALLVSHWEVDSGAAVKLVTGAIGALAMDKSIGRAEALRRAILAAMADTTRPVGWIPASHPSVWAPFVVVGEGGTGR